MQKILSDIDPYSFTGSAVIIGLLLTKELSSEEQNSIGNWLQLTGLVIQTYASQVSTLETNNNQTRDDIDSIKKAIKTIEKQLDKLKKT